MTDQRHVAFVDDSDDGFVVRLTAAGVLALTDAAYGELRQTREHDADNSLKLAALSDALLVLDPLTERL